MSTSLVPTFESAIRGLAEASARLDAAVDQRALALIAVRRKAVEAALKVASSAAAAIGNAKVAVPTDVHSQWVATLTGMQGSLRRADDLLKDAEAQGAIPSPLDAGFQIPGTNVIVPYVALFAMAAVAGLAWYATKGKR